LLFWLSDIFSDCLGFEASYAQKLGKFAQDQVNHLDFEHFTEGITGQYPLAENI